MLDRPGETRQFRLHKPLPRRHLSPLCTTIRPRGPQSKLKASVDSTSQRESTEADENWEGTMTGMVPIFYSRKEVVSLSAVISAGLHTAALETGVRSHTDRD